MKMQQRKQLRLKNYDYSQIGIYFITVCVKDKRNLFWESYKIENDKVNIKYTYLGKIAVNTIKQICDKYNIIIENYIVMPDHVHLLINIHEEQNLRKSGSWDVSEIVGAYKSLVSVEYLKYCKKHNIYMGDIWQMSFFDHIIRDDEDYYIKYKYINDNPLKWVLKRTT